MQNFKTQKSKVRKILESKLMLVLLFVALLFFAWNVADFISKSRETSLNRKIAEEKVMELQGKKEKLSTDINRLQTKDGIESSIREKFGLAKEGENVIVIIDDKNKQETEVEEKDSGFWYFLKNWFK